MPDLARLEAFVGTWTKSGRALASPFGPEATIAAVETFEWLPGGRWLVHRLDGRLGGKEMACVEVIGVEPDADVFVVESFYNDGTRNTWALIESNAGWILQGVWPIDDAERVTVRCAMTLRDDDTIAQEWEYSRDNSLWLPFWSTVLTPAGARRAADPDARVGTV